jgi:hypothetical protein
LLFAPQTLLVEAGGLSVDAEVRVVTLFVARELQEPVDRPPYQFPLRSRAAASSSPRVDSGGNSPTVCLTDITPEAALR